MVKKRPEIDTERKSHIAGVIRKYRLQAKLEQRELAKLLHVTPAAVGNWERSLSRPDLDTIPLLCRELRIPVTELLDLDPELTMTGEDRDLLDLYHSLQPDDQASARFFMEQLEWRARKKENELIRGSFCRRTLMEQASAAGFGAPMEDYAENETVYVRSNPASEKCTCIIKVNGHSMEPIYPDGSKVYVDEKQEVHFGDDGVFILNGEALIKKMTREGLYSYNQDKTTYPTRTIYESDNLKIVGKVIGRVGDFDIPEGEELREVESAFKGV